MRELPTGIDLATEPHAALNASDLSQLEHNHHRLQALVEHSADVTYIIDPQGIIRYASPNVVQLGFDPEFWKHTPVSVFDYFFSRPLEPDALRAILEGQFPGASQETVSR